MPYTASTNILTNILNIAKYRALNLRLVSADLYKLKLLLKRFKLKNYLEIL